MEYDCLIIGQYDPDFSQHLKTLKFTFGEKSAAYQDQNVTYIQHDNKPLRALDFINLANESVIDKPLTNTDMLWPAIIALASHLDKNGLSFDYLNEFKYEKELLREKLLNNKYKCIALTTTLYVSSTPIAELISFIRSVAPESFIVVGGPYVFNRTKSSSKKKVDEEFQRLDGDLFVINGDGKSTLVEVIRELYHSHSFQNIENIACKSKYLTSSDNTITTTESKLETKEKFFFFTKGKDEPALLSDMQLDYSIFHKDAFGDSISISTAKSCPYSCAFCDFPIRSGKYRYLDVLDVERELDKLYALGIKSIFFIDDTFNVPKGRFKKILELMIQKQYNFSWHSFYRSDQGDKETIELMGKAGCEGVFLGIESADDDMLERMSKTSRSRHYAEAIPLLRENGIHTHANFIIGFPGETTESIQRNINFIEKYKPDTYKAQIWYLEHGTPITNRKEEFNIEGQGFNWSHNTMSNDEAAEHVNYMHRKIKNSVYLPQEGFGLWSIFYLKRRGFRHDQIINYLRLFNNEVIRRINNPRTPNIPEGNLKELKDSATFKEFVPNKVEPIRVKYSESKISKERVFGAAGV